jgi:hypothetical protein
MIMIRCVIFLVLGAFASVAYTQLYDENESFKSLFNPVFLKAGKVKSCSLSMYSVGDGEKTGLELLEKFEFDTEGRMIKNVLVIDESTNEIDEILYEYNADGKLAKETWYEGGTKDLIDHYYFTYQYTGAQLTSKCEYEVNDSWEQGDSFEKEILENCAEYIYNAQQQLVMIKDPSLLSYVIIDYQGEFIYIYNAESLPGVEDINSPEAAKEAVLMLKGAPYKKYKNNLLLEEMLDADTKDIYTYYPDGRIKKMTETFENKSVASYIINYKKNLPVKLVYTDLEEKGYKEICNLVYTYY